MGSLLDQVAGLHAAAARAWWRTPRLEKLQRERLRSLVRHACQNFPSYRERFRSCGLWPDEIATIEDLSRVPLTTRKDLAALRAMETSSEAARHAPGVTVRTSGSSGVPLVLRYRPGDATELNCTWLRPLFAHGIRPWHSRLEITGPHNFPSGGLAYEKLGLFRRHCVSVFEKPDSWLTAARRAGADYLWGYSGSLKMLARHIVEVGHAAPRFRAVFGVSDLVDPACRELVREAFGRPLVDVYGAAEAGCIAWECPTCDGYHVNMDTVIVEVLDGDRPAPPGVAGRVVVTNLLSFAMPIIRYELGDVAATSPNAARCGRGLPLIDVVEGRANAIVRLPSGRLLSPMFFFGLMKQFENNLRAWRVIQESGDRLSVLVVAVDGKANPAPIADAIRRLAGEPIGISVVPVDALPHEASGKVRAVFSRLSAGTRP